jgi:hypothetical protein
VGSCSDYGRADFERQYGSDYQKPGLFARFLGLIYRYLFFGPDNNAREQTLQEGGNNYQTGPQVRAELRGDQVRSWPAKKV